MVRVVIVVATALAAASPGWAQAPGAIPTSGVAVESQSDFIARCTRETIAANPQSQSWAENVCRANWDRVVAAQPMVEAMLAAVPETAAPINVSALPDRLVTIQWAAQPVENAVATGRLANLDASVEDAPQPRLSFSWAAVGELVPFDPEQALRGRGAELSLVACQAFGMSATSKVFHVTLPGRAPFGLTIHSRGAPTANASAYFNASVDLAGQLPSLEDLRADPSTGEWSAICSS